MEKQHDDKLMKSRSSRACVTAGIRLFLSKFRPIFRQTWPAALIYAAAVSISGMIAIAFLPSLMAIPANASYTDALGWFLSAVMANLAGTLIILVALTILTGYGMTLLSHHASQQTILAPQGWPMADRKILGRSAVAMVWIVVFSLLLAALLCAVAMGATWSLGWKAGPAIGVAMIILTIAFFLPLEYVSMKYILTRQNGFFHHLRRGYPIGLRHLGIIFLVTLITSIMAALVTMVANLPAYVLLMANLTAYEGALAGDPLGMPSYINLLTAATLFLTGFIQAYMLMMTLFPSYYMYGSIEKQEDERAEAMHAIEQHQ